MLSPLLPTRTAQPAPEPWLDPAVVRERLEQGRIAEGHVHAPDTSRPGIAPRPAPGYFRTYEQVRAAAGELAATYPGLVEVLDIGDTSEKAAGTADRDVFAIRLTAKGINEGRKPGAMHIAGEHAREIANPELLMRHARELLAGYGTDPEATALLQTRVIDLVPMMNADGHAVIERHYAGVQGGSSMQRKNTSPPSGVDLNRNYDWHWDGGGGSSTNPRSDTYRGPSAASEPEVRAIQDHVTRSRPGIFIDWHSYSQLNLYPWGDTRDKAPDFAGLDALARKFSSWNGYTPQQSIQLYPTNGTSKDWVYGTHRTPGFTIETGTTFHQNDAQFAQSWKENAPVLTYAAKVADAPFERVLGPDVSALTIAHGADGAAIVTARTSDAANGGQPIAGAEIITDPFAAPGSGTPLRAVDGAFDTVAEQLIGSIDAHGGEQQLVYVRAHDAKGNWGPTTAQWLHQVPTA